MAYPDPQSLDIGPDTITLPRTGSGPNTGVFSSNTGEVVVRVSHAVGKRARRTARLDVQKVAPDPLFPATNVPRSTSVYLVVDAPLTGFTVTELQSIAVGLTDWLTASSNANLARLLGGEN